MKNFKNFLFVLLFVQANSLFAQASDDERKDSSLTERKIHKEIYGYLEPYYTYSLSENNKNFGEITTLDNHSLYNKPALNIAILGGKVETPRISARTSLMVEDFGFSNNDAFELSLYESAVSVHLFDIKKKDSTGEKVKKGRVYTEAGIFSSHIGFEGYIGSDCWMLTRTITAENSPYRERGFVLKSEYGKLQMNVYLLTGWDLNISPHYRFPNYGTQFAYSFNNWKLNYSNYFGSDIGTVKLLQYHNFYAIYDHPDNAGKVSFTVGLDHGNIAYNYTPSKSWTVGMMIGKYTLKNNRFALTARGEFASDPDGVIYFRSDNFIYGGAAGIDYMPELPLDAKVRFEIKYLTSREDVFPNNSHHSAKNYAGACIAFAVPF